ncbi:hypothetical protein DSCOOX_48640 [Desulfosarcina ovata subsp. ovata]|uniref:Uncharacterized protein n=1 Tax=Desulfosarcina ovata subsp. ovata TaxID=2752305 RepID=A0A5K8AIW0_9BACT|nr:hypothetical protein DSCOOX_48640 [Desulfosarcina ovata subsp. ovata]
MGFKGPMSRNAVSAKKLEGADIEAARAGEAGRILPCIAFKIMFLGCVIGRRSITIRLPPSGLAKNIILSAIANEINVPAHKMADATEGCRRR